MSKESDRKNITGSRILDLTSKQTLFELAIEEEELLGEVGLKLIEDIKERASDAEYTHLFYRDPIRPGIIWLSVLVPMSSDRDGQVLYPAPARGKLDHCRAVAEKVFPGFLERLLPDSEENIMSQIPPLSIGASGMDLATALEYLVFIYPTMVRGWATLIFTYDEILGMSDAASHVRDECASICPNAQIVSYLLSSP